MIIGAVHLYETRRAGLIGPKTEGDVDRARFTFTGETGSEVIEMLQTVLAILRKSYQEAEAQKEQQKQAERVKEAHANLHERIKQDEKAALDKLRDQLAQETPSKIVDLQGRDVTDLGKIDLGPDEEEADAMQTKAEKPLTGRQRRGRLIEDY